MTWAKLETAAVARSLSAVAAEPGDLAEVYFERRVDAEWPPDEARCGLRIRREEGLAVRLVRGEHAWLASRDRITGSELVSALRQVARTQPATMLEPELAVGPCPAVPIAALRGFAGELERAIRRHHVAFPFRLTARWHRRDLQVVGPRWVPESESESFFSLDIDLPWGRCGALTTALQAGDAERIARALVARFRAREASPPPSGRYPLLLAPAATAVLLHEAVGHALEADLLPAGGDDLDRGDLRGLRGLRDLRRSALVGDPRTGIAATAETQPALDILDDPQRAPRGVTRSTDDEGQPVQRRWLIRSGKVEQPIADGLHALRSGRWLPGSGFRAGRHDAPLPRMHHLELLPGSFEASELARSAPVFHAADAADAASTAATGLFIAELDQGALDPESGEVVLHAPCGRYIRGGELAEPCGPLTLRCHVAEILSAVVAVGNDSVTAGAGWCAKDGQRRAVWATAPSIALAPLAVSGGRSERCP